MTADDTMDEVGEATVVASLQRFLFTADEVALSLAISKTMVRQLTVSGELPCRRIGRLVRYTPEDVESFVASLDERGYRGRSGH